MKFVRRILLLSIGSMACALFSPPVHPESSVTPSAIETLALIPTDAPTQIPATQPSGTLSAAEFTPILYRRYLSRYYEFQVVGGVQGGNWLPAGAVADQIRFEQAFDLYASEGYAGTAIAIDYGIPLSDPICGITYIGSDFEEDVPNLIGVAQGWDVTRRAWGDIPVNTPVYYSAVADWLVSQGFTLPAVEIERILRVDLEGDGVDEVFISASYFKDESGHMAEQGDYSIILMRKVVGSEVATVPVAADLYTAPGAALAFPFTYSLVNLLDLNQDGTLELIVEATRWEGGGVMIYEVNGTDVSEALSVVCNQ